MLFGFRIQKLLLFALICFIPCIQGCLEKTVSASTGHEIDLSGFVFDETMKPQLGVVVRLGALADTTGPDGRWAINGTHQNIDKENAVAVQNAKFRLTYSFFGEIFAEDTITNLTQSNLRIGIQQHSIQGKLSLSQNVKVDSVIAWLDAREASTKIRSKLTYNIADSSYSGSLYSELSLSGQTTTARAWINVMGNGNLKTGISDTVFASSNNVKNIQVAPFSVRNAIPDAKIAGPTSGFVGVEREFRVNVSGNTETIRSFEWNASNTDRWQQGDSIRRIKWISPGEYSLRVRLTDIDSNKVVVSLPVTITKLPATIIGLPRDSSDTITPGIEREYSVNVSDPNGVKVVIWSFRDGSSQYDTTYGGPVSAVRHKWSALKGQLGYRLALRGGIRITIIDSFGNQSYVNRDYWYIDDVPSLIQQDLFAEPNTLLPIRPKVLDYGPISKVEWSSDGKNFSVGSMDTAIRLGSSAGTSKTIYHRVTDISGNTSPVDSICIFIQNSFADARDGERYFYAKIGNQVWMTQNLRFNVPGSILPSNNADSAMLYGRHYTYTQALNLPDTCNTLNCHSLIDTNATRQGVCPMGWHIPKMREWDTLRNAAGFGELITHGGWFDVKYGRPIEGQNTFGFSLRSENREYTAFWPDNWLWCPAYNLRFGPIPPQATCVGQIHYDKTDIAQFGYFGTVAISHSATEALPVRCIQD